MNSPTSTTELQHVCGNRKGKSKKIKKDKFFQRKYQTTKNYENMFLKSFIKVEKIPIYTIEQVF